MHLILRAMGATIIDLLLFEEPDLDTTEPPRPGITFARDEMDPDR